MLNRYRRCGVSANETTLHPNNNLKKVNHYRSVYGLQHAALAYTEQLPIKGPTITSVKPFKRENQRSNSIKHMFTTTCTGIVRKSDIPQNQIGKSK